MTDAAAPVWGSLAAAGYLAVFWLAGWLLARRVFPAQAGGQAGDAGLQAAVHLCLGASFGLGLLAALPALAALVLGFGRAAVLAALGAVLALSLAAVCIEKNRQKQAAKDAARWVWRRGDAGRARAGASAPEATAHAADANTVTPKAAAGAAKAGNAAADNNTATPETTTHTADINTGTPGATAAGTPLRKAPAAGAGLRAALALWACVLPLLGFTVWLLHTHTLYQKGGAYWCGQSTFGDLPMHLAFIKSIAVQGKFPPGYSLLAGQERFGYPFLCETVSSALLVLGAPLKTACLLPQALAVLAVLGSFWLLAHWVLGNAGKASLAFWLFFAGGGFGFFYFLGGEKGNFSRIFTAFYETPTNYIKENIRWVNPIADMMIPQRATLFGWALLLGCICLLYRFAFEGEGRLWLPLALLAGCLPLTHTHSLLALVLLSAVYLVRAVLDLRTAGCAGRPAGAARWRALLPWLGYAALAGALCLPQLALFIFPQTSEGANFLRMHWNWANEGDNYFWFYIKNIGLVYLLLVPAFLHASKKQRWLYGGGLAILALAECVVFQPNNYDNNKLLFIWHMLGCMLAAGLLCEIAASLWHSRGRYGRAAAGALLAGAAFLGTFSGLLTLGREAVSQYEQFSADGVAAAAYVDEHAAPDAVFLTGTHHLNPVASLAGRQILCGSGSYVYFHGMHYAAQAEAVRALYEAPDEATLAEWGIDYVCISGWERADYAVDEGFYAARYPVWYQGGGYIIYAVGGA